MTDLRSRSETSWAWRQARRPMLAVALIAAVPSWVAAQDSTMSRAFELERRGNYAAAAAAYRSLLQRDPAAVAPLLGLERALMPLGRSSEILPEVQAALRAPPGLKASGAGPVYGVALRAYAGAGLPDSLEAVAERWAGASPGDETPYREWGAAALGAHDRPGARTAYQRGRERLHRPDALAAEMAQLAIADGDYRTALGEWLPAVRRLPGYRATATTTLVGAPDSIRPDLLDQLGREHDFPARRLDADLRARWGDPLGAVERLADALPDSRPLAIDALRGLNDQLRLLTGRDAREAQGRTLELLADRTTASERARLRLDAARAYSAAGRRDDARRMLAGIANDHEAPGPVAAGASTTLVQVLIGDGKLDEAATRLAQHRTDLSGDEYAALRRKLVVGFVQAGNLDRADSLLAGDSTVDGLALQGRLRLYRGQVAGAIERFRAAGPFAGDRTDATERTALLAMLQPIEADTLPRLGAAFLALARGDTGRAVAGLTGVGRDLAPAKGGAEIQLFAGRLAAASGQAAEAERLYRAAAAPAAPGTAPAAELALAELWLEQRRPADAVAQLEHLILTYPSSALVPQARRRLDEARGAVPQT